MNDPLLAAIQSGDLVMPIVGLILAVGVLILALVWTRRWLFGPQSNANPESWTLEDLRRLRDQGKISDEEYHRLIQSEVKKG